MRASQGPVIAEAFLVSALFQIASATTSAAMVTVPDPPISVIDSPATVVSAALRLRSEEARFQTGGETQCRYRSRMRLRLAATHELEHGLRVGARLSTGAPDDATSSQFTFGDSFSKRELLLDQAYVRWAPFAAFAATGGKMANPFVQENLLWDKDVSPEGLAARGTVGPLFGTAGVFLLQESEDGRADVTVSVGQVGLAKRAGAVRVSMAGAYYAYANLTRTELISGKRGANTRRPEGTLFYEYDIAAFLVSASFASRLPVALSIETSRNLSAPEGSADGLGAELRIGSSDERGDWMLSLSGQRLERDATPDILTESSWHDQRTNYQGVRVGLRWKAFEHGRLTLHGKLIEAIEGPADDEARVTFDAEFEK